MYVQCKVQAWFLGKLSHCFSSVSHSSSCPGEEPGSGADICKLHLQLLPGCSPQLFCLPGSDTGLLPSTSGEPGHRGLSSSHCPGPGSPGWPAGAGLPGAVHTVRRQTTCIWHVFVGVLLCVGVRTVLYQTVFEGFLRPIKTYVCKIIYSLYWFFSWQDRKASAI